MISIGDTLVSDELLEEVFACDLKRCKGACCVEGDAGAPLEAEEVGELDRIFEKVKPYLRPEGLAAIEAQGTSMTDLSDGEPVTPLVNGAECAYVTFAADGSTRCGLEQAWQDGATDFRKPVSCQLYPIRIERYPHYDALNYHRWSICSPACELGRELKMPVYRFAREALIRKYGPDWYAELEDVAALWEQSS